MAQETKYCLYYLYDPRNMIVCYVGVTNNFKTRLGQHCRPKPTLQTKIAKLQRFLLKNGMSLIGEPILFTDNKDYVSMLEQRSIKRLFRSRGKKQIKNTADGGYSGYTISKEVRAKMLATRLRNNKPPKCGEESPQAKLTEGDVLKVYSLIKQYYSDVEIVTMIDKDVGRTAIASLRRGGNWKHLWIKEGMFVVPSIPVVKNGLSTQSKISLIKDIENGMSTLDIRLKYKMGSTDIERIRSRSLWATVWNVYDNFIKVRK